MGQSKRRNKILQCRVSDKEYELIYEAFSKSGCQSISEYMREIVLNGYCCTFEIDKTELSKLRRAVASISNNINQIAIRVNSTGAVYAEDIAEIKKGVEKAWQQQACILSLLHRQEQ